MNFSVQKQNPSICFRRWGNRSFSAFRTINKVVVISVLSTVYFSAIGLNSTFAQTDTTLVNPKIELDEVVVSSDRTPKLQSEVARIVTVISRSEIDRAAAYSIDELLEFALNVDVRQRGGFGIQSDVSVRGGTFDQVMILLNGVNITDPQTGHHNLSLPVDISSIERIEVLHGPGARIWGPNAFTGAINVITKSADNNKVQAGVVYGAHNLFSANVGLNLKSKNLTNYIASAYKESDGYMANTDFVYSNLFYQGHYQIDNSMAEWQFGYSDKGFGAANFYSPKYDNQYEQVKTTFGSVKFTSGDKLKVSSSLYFRRNNDRFELFRDVAKRLAWYKNHNYHLTDIYGASINAWLYSALGKSSFGGELRSENVLSNVLGNLLKDTLTAVNQPNGFYSKSFTRTNFSIFAEHQFVYHRFSFALGVMGNLNSSLPKSIGIYPGLDASFKISDDLSLYGSVSKSLRMPTFTDLFYNGPTNVGNPNLKPEEATSYEGGLKYFGNVFRANAGVFYRQGKNLIDWVKFNPTDAKYSTVNYTKLDSYGFEFGSVLDATKLFEASFPLQTVMLNYAWIDSRKEASNVISIYALDYLKHKLDAKANFKFFDHFGLNFGASYQLRNGNYSYYETPASVPVEKSYNSVFLLDAKAIYSRNNYQIFVEATNLLDTKYVDLGNIIQPGLWAKLGIKIDLKPF